MDFEGSQSLDVHDSNAVVLATCYKEVGVLAEGQAVEAPEIRLYEDFKLHAGKIVNPQVPIKCCKGKQDLVLGQLPFTNYELNISNTSGIENIAAHRILIHVKLTWGNFDEAQTPGSIREAATRMGGVLPHNVGAGFPQIVMFPYLFDV